MRLQAIGLFAQSAEFLIDLFQAIARVRVGFLAQSLPLDFKLHDAAFNFVNFCGERIDFHAKSGGGFVNKVDGFIGKEAVRDVALGEHGSGYDGGILDAHAVVNFVALFKTAQNGDGVFHRRFTDIYRLKAPLKRGIFFDVLAIFVERGSTDRAQLSAREGGLEHVGSVHGAFGSACADECVQLIDEEIIWPSDSVTSLRTAFKRSSNSPRYFAPAISAERSSDTMRFGFRTSGTSPEMIRCARPSTMAVLPTPGSPIRTGLFFVRRARICITRRISSSRPITGSSLPRRARSVRSRAYCSSAR